MELFPAKLCLPPLAVPSSTLPPCTRRRATERPSLSSRLATHDRTPCLVQKKNNLDQHPVCLMEESLSITAETLESLDPLNSPALEIPCNTMKRRNPYLIKFPPLRLIRYLDSISVSAKCRAMFFFFFFFYTL